MATAQSENQPTKAIAISVISMRNPSRFMFVTSPRALSDVLGDIAVTDNGPSKRFELNGQPYVLVGTHLTKNRYGAHREVVYMREDAYNQGITFLRQMQELSACSQDEASRFNPFNGHSNHQKGLTPREVGYSKAPPRLERYL